MNKGHLVHQTIELVAYSVSWHVVREERECGHYAHCLEDLPVLIKPC